jgi:predicted dehydrogenase
MRIGLVGVDSSHADDFLRLVNVERRYSSSRVAAIWGADADRARGLAEQFGVEAVANFAALIGKVDAVIVGDRHGDLHLAHALPFLAAGLPVFVDKPLACSVHDAGAIVAAAQTSGAPLASASAVRWQEDADALSRRIAELGGATHIIASGSFQPDSEYGGAIFYGIHTVELALQLAGSDFSDIAVDLADPDAVVATCKVGAKNVTIHLVRQREGEASFFTAEAECPGGIVAQTIGLGDDYMAPVLERFIAMVESGKARMSGAELLAPVRLIAEIQRAIDSAA